MKPTIPLLVLLSTLFVENFAAQAQSYAISSFTIDGGGGQSTGGVYSVSGTIGQADTGKASGGSYTLEGGFWSVISVFQTPGAPRLSMRLSPPGAVIISWPASSTGFELEENLDLRTTNWSKVLTTPVMVGEEKQIVVPGSIGNRLYRLRRQ